MIAGGRSGTSIVSNTTIHKETKLVRARTKLEQSVARLEAALEEKLAKAQGDNPEVVALQDELENLKADNARLKLLNKTVSGRLDNTIGRLKTVLES